METSIRLAFALLLITHSGVLRGQVNPPVGGGGQTQVPQLINYQGRVVVGTTNFTGTGQFKFALISQGIEGPPISVWKNDGSVGNDEPAGAVALTVTNGLYSVLLGDTMLSNMTAIPPSVFGSDHISLRVWFDDGTQGSQLLAPDQRIAAVGYAFMAAGVQDRAITTQKIALGAVGSNQIADGAVGLGKIGNGAVTADAIAQGAIVSTLLAPNLNVAGTFFVDGELALPATTGLHNGVVSIGGNPFLHYSPGLSGVLNTFVGAGAGNFIMTGRFNTAIGATAFGANDGGQSNTAIGYQALGANTHGSNNIAVGSNAGVNLTEGDNNIAIGHGGIADEEATIRVGIQGTQTATYIAGIRGAAIFNGFPVYVDANGKLGTPITADNDNTAIGRSALAANLSGDYNTAAGAGAMISNTNGFFNTATGLDALYHNLTGSRNTATGASALFSNESGSDNIALGQGAGGNITGNANIDIGNQGVAGESTTIRIGTPGTHTKTFLAGISGTASPAGAVVFVAANGRLGTRTDDLQNTRLGESALGANTAGANNTAVGRETLFSNIDGYHNTAVGERTLHNNLSGSYNTAVGDYALFDAAGEGNIGIGAAAGSESTWGSDNIHIGNVGDFSDDGMIRIGTEEVHTDTFIAGVFGHPYAPGAPVYATSAGQLYTAASSGRFKRDIQPMGDASSVILKLNPVTFRYKAGAPDAIHFGLIAEEANEVDPNLVLRDAKGEIYTVRYEAVNAMLLNEFLKEHRRVGELEARLAELEAKDKAREERLAKLERLSAVGTSPAAPDEDKDVVDIVKP